MWLAVHGVPPSAYFTMDTVGWGRAGTSAPQGAVSALPSLPFLASVSISSQSRCETFLAHSWNIFAGSGLSFSEGAYCFSFCLRICPRALELAPFTNVEFLVPAWHPTCFAIPCGLIGQTLQSSASDGKRTAGTLIGLVPSARTTLCLSSFHISTCTISKCMRRFEQKK
jgi:hypothetical protein